jgi:hypothetical protein
MRRRIIASILIGLTLILSTFISTVSLVQKIAYAQTRMEPSSNGVPVLNSMTERSNGVTGPSTAGKSITNGPQTFVQQQVNPSNVAKLLTAASYFAGRNSVVQGIIEAPSSVQMTSAEHPISKIVTAIKYLQNTICRTTAPCLAALLKYINNKDNPIPPAGVSSPTTAHNTASLFGAFFQTAGKTVAKRTASTSTRLADPASTSTADPASTTTSTIADPAVSLGAQRVTLIELVIPVIALGILAAVAIPQFIDLSSDAKNACVMGVNGALGPFCQSLIGQG